MVFREFRECSYTNSQKNFEITIRKTKTRRIGKATSTLSTHRSSSLQRCLNSIRPLILPSHPLMTMHLMAMAMKILLSSLRLVFRHQLPVLVIFHTIPPIQSLLWVCAFKSRGDMNTNSKASSTSIVLLMVNIM